MPDLRIIQGDLENFSHELGEVLTDISTYTAHPLKLTLVQKAHAPLRTSPTSSPAQTKRPTKSGQPSRRRAASSPLTHSEQL